DGHRLPPAALPQGVKKQALPYLLVQTRNSSEKNEKNKNVSSYRGESGEAAIVREISRRVLFAAEQNDLAASSFSHAQFLPYPRVWGMVAPFGLPLRFARAVFRNSFFPEPSGA